MFLSLKTRNKKHGTTNYLNLIPSKKKKEMIPNKCKYFTGKTSGLLQTYAASLMSSKMHVLCLSVKHVQTIYKKKKTCARYRYKRMQII